MAYLVSEEVLREVLVCLNDHGTAYLNHEDEYATAVTTLAAILANPPSEPVAWGVLWKDGVIRNKYETEAGATCDLHHAQWSGCAVDKAVPLYLKDTI